MSSSPSSTTTTPRKRSRNKSKKRPHANLVVADPVLTNTPPLNKKHKPTAPIHDANFMIPLSPRRVGSGSGRQSLPRNSNADAQVHALVGPLKETCPAPSHSTAVSHPAPTELVIPASSVLSSHESSSSSDDSDGKAEDTAQSVPAATKLSSRNIYSVLDPDVQEPAAADDATQPELDHQTSPSVSSTNIMLKRPFITQPSFRFNLVNLCKPLFLKDIQQLILWFLSHDRGTNPPFLMVQNRAHIRKLVVLHVPRLNPHRIITSLSPDCPPQSPIEMPPKRRTELHVQHNPTSLGHIISANPNDIVPECKSLASIFPYVLPLCGAGHRRGVEDPIPHLFNVHMSREEKQNLKKKHYSFQMPDKTYSIIPLLLTKERMKRLELPIHPFLMQDSMLPDGWRCLDIKPATRKPTDANRVLLAMDCEMCLADGNESILTRIAVVSEQGTTLLDTLVAPSKPIIDYLTQYSGVSAAMLEGVTTTLSDVQKKVISILTPETILIGHSIENDLRALKLTHPFLIDTSTCYSASPSQLEHRRPKLRLLAHRYLERAIQSVHSNSLFGNQGHSPAEDALACIDLIKLKMKHGPEFGLRDPVDNVLEYLKKADPPKLAAWCDNIRSCNQHGSAAQHVFSTFTDNETATSVRYAITKTDASFIWGQLLHLDQTLKQSKDTLRPDACSVEPSPKAISECLAGTTRLIVSVWNTLPAGSVLMVFSASGEPELMNAMNLENFAARNEPTKPMDLPDFRTKFYHALRMAKAGCCMFSVKP